MSRNKKGAMSVFLTLLLVTFILAIGVIAENGGGKAARSYGHGVLDLAGRSVLSEFCRELKDDYGLMGFTKEKAVIEEDLEWYCNKSFIVNKGKTNLMRLRIYRLSADPSQYVLTNPRMLEGQIMEFMKYRAPAKLAVSGLSGAGLLEQAASGKDKTANLAGEKRTERRLQNETVLEGLPSRLHGLRSGGLPELDSLPDIDHLFTKNKENLYTNLYILERFRHRNDPPQWEDTFFVNEIEYILAGNQKDSRNRISVKTSLILLRTGINTAHIYSDPVKRRALMAAAVAISPGPQALITQALLTAAWAGAEAANDLARLEEGGKVPLWKTKEDWMLDLDSIVEGRGGGAVLRPAQQRGLNYEGYLLLLLFFENQDTKLIRVMDLIQLNMQGNYDQGFRLSGCFGGFDISAELVRRKGFLGAAGRRTGTFFLTEVYFPEEVDR